MKYKDIKNIRAVLNNIQKKKVSKNVVDFIVHYKPQFTANAYWLYVTEIIEEIKDTFNTEKDMQKLLKKYPELLEKIN